MEKLIKQHGKPIFLIWLLSVLCYLPLIAKGITNSFDGLWASSYYQAGDWELSIGRWAWLFLDKARMGYGAEPFQSFLTLILLSISIYIALRMFIEVSYKFYIYAFLMTCSVAVCCYLSYRYMSPTFGLSTLLAVVAAWFITRDADDKKQARNNLFVGIGLIIVCLGLYQANIGYFCVIAIIYMLKLLYEGDNGKCFNVFKRCLILGIAGCLIYKLCWDICLFLRGVSAADYNGANSVSIISIFTSIPSSLKLIMHAWNRFFFVHVSNYVFYPVRVMIAVIIFLLVLYVGIKKFIKNPKNLVLYILLCVCLPIGANIAFILAPGAKTLMFQMTGPMTMVLPLLLCFLEDKELKVYKALPVLAALLLYGNIYAVGTDIDAMAQGSNTCREIMNNIVVSMDSKGLLSADKKYAFYGNLSKNELFYTNELFDAASGYAKFGVMQTTQSIQWNTYTGLIDKLGLKLERCDYENYKDIMDSELLEKMPAYPAEGSIVEKDGIVIVKVADEYKNDK